MKDKLHIFGTCAGTEPMPGRHHCSFALEHDGLLYWFDAGENCSYTAYLMGLNLMKVHSVFISHPHMDHIGGLGNLMWNIRKLDSLQGMKMGGQTVNLFMPNAESWPSLFGMLSHTEGNFKGSFSVREQRVHDGIIFDENGVTVEALHNLHLPQQADGTWTSFSYRIRVGGKSIVFSGDVRNYTEIAPLYEDADVVIVETGHHRPVKVCSEFNEMGCAPKSMLFIHHGRSILEEGDAAIEEARPIYPGRMIVMNDGDTYDLDELVAD